MLEKNIEDQSCEGIPEANPLVPKGYSLEADMLLGWRPKNIRQPIEINFPLNFPTWKKAEKGYKKVYSGYRPSDSYSFHRELSDGSDDTYKFDFSDPHINTYMLTKQKSSAERIKNEDPTGLIFDSFFESGNLDRAIMIAEDEYDLYMRCDTNTNGHLHWFYFSVSGIKSPRTIRFNIVNFSRSSVLYQSNMRPVGFSTEKVRLGLSKNWDYVGDDVKFKLSKINDIILSKRPYYILTFSYHFEYPNDKVWFATAIPYTLCRLDKILNSIVSDEKAYQIQHVSVQTLCKTLCRIDVPIITITDPSVPEAEKQYIIATARVHPAETVGSWVMEGFIRFISSKHPEAKQLRKKFVFKIIPMCNPDGVVIGNSRTSIDGKDLNRLYINPDENMNPTGFHIKSLVRNLISENKAIFMFIDMHGHFSKKGSFIYGPYYPIHHSNYFKTRIIPKLLSERTPIFRYYSSRFKIEKSKKKAARGVMWKEFGIANSYTLETSYYGFINDNREVQSFTTTDLLTLGEKVARSILEYQLMLESKKNKKNINQFLKKSFAAFKESNKQKPNKESTNTPVLSDKSPTNSIFSLKFEPEFHEKKELEEWINIIKEEEPQQDSSSSESDDEISEEEIIIKQEIEEEIKSNAPTELKSNTYQLQEQLSYELPPLEPKSIKSASRNLSRNSQNNFGKDSFEENPIKLKRQRFLSNQSSIKRQQPISLAPKFKFNLSSFLMIEKRQKEIYKETPKMIKAFITPKKLIETVKKEIDLQSSIMSSPRTMKEDILELALNKKGLSLYHKGTHRKGNSLDSQNTHMKDNPKQVKIQIEALDTIFHNLAYI
ncbi:unnamed protein product [Blepharisma stoltei]|uniref:Peptidase M14 domain-containing protein n=1 Tax=Blepharisma stoltei TaxID=1481888 RepID=A0AAU9JF66_9CILI|nr:unnamed protein product [Blepharisma stoltei]